MEWAGRLTPEEFWAVVADGEQQVRESAARLPVYGLVAGPTPAMVGEWGFEGGARVIVYGEPAEWREDAVIPGLEEPHAIVRTGDDTPRSGAAVLLRDAGILDPAADSAPPDDILEVVVEATPVLFELWRAPGRWWAAGRYHEDVIAFAGVGVRPEECRLVRVADVEPLLAERRDWIARMREEALPD